MSYHNDPYRVDYLKIYPCLKERPDVLEVLKKSDRKMKYMEVDLKSEQRRKNAENGAESYVPSKEDSLERLVYSAKCQFADDAEGVEDAVIKKDDLSHTMRDGSGTKIWSPVFWRTYAIPEKKDIPSS